MSLVTAAASAGNGMRRLMGSLADFRVRTGRVLDTRAAAALVPGIFRRQTPADIASLTLQQAISTQQVRPFSRTTEADRVALQREQETTEQQSRPFRR